MKNHALFSFFVFSLVLSSPSNAFGQNDSCFKILKEPQSDMCDDWLNGKCGEDLGNLYLFEESFAYARPFCRSAGDRFTYVNEQGEEIYLTVNKFSHQFLGGNYNMGKNCPNNPLESLWYCSYREVISIDFSLSNYTGEFTLAIHPKSERRRPSPEKSGDYLEITHPVAENRFTYDMMVVIHSGTQEVPIMRNQKSKNRIKLNGTVYRDVLYRKPKPSKYKRFNFYVNTSQGIVGFEDTEGVLWSLQE